MAILPEQEGVWISRHRSSRQWHAQFEGVNHSVSWFADPVTEVRALLQCLIWLWSRDAGEAATRARLEARLAEVDARPPAACTNSLMHVVLLRHNWQKMWTWIELQEPNV